MSNENSFRCEYFTQDKEAFQKWQSKQHESVSQYTLRKRKAELRALVRKVIREELNSQQQLLVKLHWYDGLSVTEIALKTGLSKSTVSRKLEAVNNTVYDKLKYAIEYRFGPRFSEDAKIIIRNADSIMYCENPSGISQRLKALRKKQCLSIQELAVFTGISAKTLEECERNESSLTTGQAVILSKFYDVSCDYILTGKTGYFS